MMNIAVGGNFGDLWEADTTSPKESVDYVRFSDKPKSCLLTHRSGRLKVEADRSFSAFPNVDGYGLDL